MPRPSVCDPLAFAQVELCQGTQRLDGRSGLLKGPGKHVDLRVIIARVEGHTELASVSPFITDDDSLSATECFRGHLYIKCIYFSVSLLHLPS